MNPGFKETGLFSAVLLNTNYRKYENESITFYEQLFKKADQAEYEVISELEIWKQNRVNRYDYRYFCVPEEGDLELVLMMLNILQEQSFGDLVHYGIEGTDWQNTGTLECKIGANANSELHEYFTTPINWRITRVKRYERVFCRSAGGEHYDTRSICEKTYISLHSCPK